MAATDTFEVRISGRGGHGAMPHLSADPVVAAAAVVSALQPLVSRETSPTDGAVVTVARFNTGGRLSLCTLLCTLPLPCEFSFSFSGESLSDMKSSCHFNNQRLPLFGPAHRLSLIKRPQTTEPREALNDSGPLCLPPAITVV